MLSAFYGRVSTLRQENEETIENQIMAIKEFAGKNGHTIIQEYRDEGWSGTILARPALDEMRLDAKKKVWQAVIIYDPDRLARRYAYQELVTDELNELGIQVLYVTTPPAKDESDKLLYGVKGLFAEYERAKIADRFRLGKLRKAREGHVVTGAAPYGYDYIPKQGDVDGFYQVNKTEAAIVKMIFQWVGNEGLTIRKVIKQLQELGVPPRKSKRGVWNSSTLTTLLRNETYIGSAYFNRSIAVIPENPIKIEKYKREKKTSRRIKPQEDWVRIKVPAIIEKELWKKAGEQLKVNFELSARNKKNEYLLAGKIRCICGRTRAGEGAQKNKHLYYRCTDRVSCYPLPPKCEEKGVNARIADKLVWDAIAGFMASPKLMKAQVQRWIQQKQTKSSNNVNSVRDLEDGLEKLKKEEGRYVKALGVGVVSIDQLKGVMNDIKTKRADLERQIGLMRENFKETDIIVSPSDADIEQFSRIAKSLLGSLDFQAKQGITRKVVNTIVAEQKLLKVRGYLCIKEVENVGFKFECRNCRVAECGEVDVV